MNDQNFSLAPEMLGKIEHTIQKELQLNELPKLKYKIIYDDDRRIYKIKVEEELAFFILKIRGINSVKAQDLDQSDLEKEYKLLSNAWQSVKNMPTKFSMSKPILLLPKYSAILMSGCPGSNLNSLFNQNLFKWTFKIQNLQQMIRNSGCWLGHYHKLSSEMSDLTASLTNRQKNLIRMINFLDTNQLNPLDQTTLSKIRLSFEQLLNSETKGYSGQVHGNFAYRNILCDEGGANLVDFEDAHQEHVAYDIGQFIAEIMFKSQFPWIRYQTEKLVGSFLDGYRSHFSVNESVSSAYVTYHLITNLYEHCGRKNSKGLKNLILRYRIRFLGKLIQRFVSRPTTLFK